MNQLEGRARAIQILRLLQDGLDLEEIRPMVPNMARQGTPGVSRAAIEQIQRGAVHLLLVTITRGQRPSWLPPELWPPLKVREAINLERRSFRKYRLLKMWLTPGGRTARGLSQAEEATLSRERQ